MRLDDSCISLVKGLTPMQQLAVKKEKGPLLINGAAGNGKTEVIIRRSVYLVEALQHRPNSIVVFTKTRKAVNNMSEQMSQVSNSPIEFINFTTIHDLCCEMLRKHLNIKGFNKDFTLYDEADSCVVIRDILKELKLHEAIYKGIYLKIRKLKSAYITPSEFIALEDGFGFEEKLARIYVRYNDELKRNNALDFDDLINFTIELLSNNDELTQRYRSEYNHIMMDDFQDICESHYMLLKLLTNERQNICIAGDEAQSITCVFLKETKNFFELFKTDFPNAVVVDLDQNFRSTASIMTAAQEIINNNNNGKCETRCNTQKRGENVVCCINNTDVEETTYIARTIKELYLKGIYNYNQFAIFFRVSQQCKTLEESLKIEGLPYKIFDNSSYFQKKEVKDAIAYMKLIANPSDSVSFKRIINSPPRGISQTLITKLEHESRRKDNTLFDAFKHYIKNSVSKSAVNNNLRVMVDLLDELIAADYKDAKELLGVVLEKNSLSKWLTSEYGESFNELFRIATEKNVNYFIDYATLHLNIDEASNENAVNLVHINSAKGFEYPVVFISGLEDGLIPHFNAIKNHDILKEERKLLYLGMTRAKDILILTGARKRKLYTTLQTQEPSRFIDELPEHCCEIVEKKSRKLSADSAINLKKANSTLPSLPNGTRVKHPTWGIGIVRDCYDVNEDIKVMVNFNSVGVKKLSLKFANLEKL